jgi:hypothetical protein
MWIHLNVPKGTRIALQTLPVALKEGTNGCLPGHIVTLAAFRVGARHSPSKGGTNGSILRSGDANETHICATTIVGGLLVGKVSQFFVSVLLLLITVTIIIVY